MNSEQKAKEIDRMLNRMISSFEDSEYDLPDLLSHKKVDNIELAKQLIDKKEFYQLANCTPEILCSKINGVSIFQILLENNIEINPSLIRETLEESIRVNEYKWLYEEENLNILNAEEIIKESIINLYQKGKLEELSLITEEELLAIEVDEDKTLTDAILDNEIDLNIYGEIQNKKLIKSIIEHKATYLYEKIDVDVLVKNYDLNRTFLDVIMEQKKDDESVNVRIPSTPGTTLAKIILAYCKNGFKKELYLTVTSLINTNLSLGKNLLDFLLDEDRDATLNYVLSEKSREFPSIKTALMIHDFKGKVFEGGNIKERFEKGKLEEYSKMQVTQEQEELLNKLREVLTDDLSDENLINMTVLNYRRLFAEKNPCANEVIHIIEMKEKGINFSLKNATHANGNSYDPRSNTITLGGMNIKAFNHEISHTLFDQVSLRQVPEIFEEVINRIVNNPETLKKVYIHSLEYSKAESDVNKKVEALLEEEYNSYVTEEHIKEVDTFLKTVDIKNEDIKKIFAKHKVVTAKEFVEKEKEIKRKECERLILENTYPNLTSISDILDAIYAGKYYDGKLKYQNKSIKCKWGHGSEYYFTGIELIFNEILADYSRIIKTPNPQEGIEQLRFYVGDELVDLLDKYYKENMLNIISDEINNLNNSDSMIL